MEDAKDNKQETVVNNTTEEVTNSLQQPEQQEQQQQDKQLQQEELKKQEDQDKQIETPGEKQQPPEVQYDIDEDDDDDDDEEKDTSQKLVIDIPEEEEEEEKVEEEDEVIDYDDVIALADLPQEAAAKKENEKVSPKLEKVDAIITLSDGEEDIGSSEAVSKPGKIQKRRSMGASSATDEESYRLKRRKINAAGAPKLPLTGYVRYMHDRRESMRKEHPSKTHMEHTKMIGEEWHSLPADVKSSYLKAADADKQRYVKELNSFLKSRPDVLASELAKNKMRKSGENNNSPNNIPAATTSSTAVKTAFKDKIPVNEGTKTIKDNFKDKTFKEMVATPSTSQQAVDKYNNEKNKCKRTPTPPIATTNTTTTTTNASSSVAATLSSLVTPTPGEIPIFTNEFLEHNKIYDMELRSLRKSKTDLEQQNSVLEKHVENMKFGVEKMITENNELEEKNRLLEIYLDKLKRKLAVALSALPLPSAPNGATVDNIDNYMQDLYKMSTSNSTGPATLNKAKDIIRKLDLQIQL